ncbi:RNA 2',3'-cyclic phosphodiesterase [soil metagenome]
MRLFLALELSAGLVQALAAATEPLRAEAPALAWVPDDKCHLTLKFLGDVPDDRLERIVAMCEEVACRQRPVAMQLGGFGAFPNFQRARVVWTGVEHESRLELLHHDVENASGEEGFELGGRAFRPHVTVARVRTPLWEDEGRRLARVAQAIDFSATQDVAAISLFESMLAPAGATYRRGHAATLGGR